MPLLSASDGSDSEDSGSTEDDEERPEKEQRQPMGCGQQGYGLRGCGHLYGQISRQCHVGRAGRRRGCGHGVSAAPAAAAAAVDDLECWETEDEAPSQPAVTPQRKPGALFLKILKQLVKLFFFFQLYFSARITESIADLTNKEMPQGFWTCHPTSLQVGQGVRQ